MVQTWLKKYVYLRVASEKEIKMHPKKAEKAALSKKNNYEFYKFSLVTFFVSAIWHGYYPTYYVSFFIGFLILQVTKYIYKAGWKFSFIPEPLLYVIR